MPDIPYLVRNEYYLEPLPRSILFATSGGQGSFSYSDTKVYGPRQQPQIYTAYTDWYRLSQISSQDRQLIVDPISGLLTYADGDVLSLSRTNLGSKGLIIPGSGGSAKAPGKRFFGSRAIGYNPNGLVLIRLIKIT